jgi:hypothetical protein
MCAIREFILSKLPVGYIKYTYMSTQLAYYSLNQFLGKNTETELHKKELPYMTIHPVFPEPNNDGFMYDIPLTKTITQTEYSMDRRCMFYILRDEINLYSLVYTFNRDQIEFDVTISVETLNQQLDLFNYIKNYFIVSRTFALPTALEAMIPRSIIDVMSKLSQNDISDPSNGKVPIFLKYLNKLSRYPITYKIRNSTSKDEYFMYYPHKLFVTIDDLSRSEGNRKNFTDVSFDITFHMYVEFNMPAKFMIVGDREKVSGIDVDLISKNSTGSTVDFVPVFTLTNLYTKYASLLNGYRLYISSLFTTDKNKKDKDEININELMESEYLAVIQEYTATNTNVDPIVNVILLKDREEQIKGTDWDLDWNKLKLTINHPDSSFTYRVLIYINSIFFNERLIKYIDTGRKEKSGL